MSPPLSTPPLLFSDRIVKTIMDVMFPVFYACEEGELTEDLANEFKRQVFLVDNLVVGGEVLAGELDRVGGGVGGAGGGWDSRWLR